MRKLASIQVISGIEPIEGADKIRLARVLGWKSVIADGQFNIGDKCIFVEIDSVFPDKPEFEIFRKRGNRLKTIRLRGQVSQGVCLPLSLLPKKNYSINDDVTEELGIKKYEPPCSAIIGGDIKGIFPSFLKKTDETRVQVLQKLIKKYKGKLFNATEKLDGCSVTYFYKDGEFGVCSHNFEMKRNEKNTMWKIANQYDIESKLKAIGFNIAIQGELVGFDIQENNYKLKEQDFYVFDAFDIDKYEYINIDNLQPGLKTAPKIITNFEMTDSVDELVEMSIGSSYLNPNAIREGLVFRLYKEAHDIDLDMRVSFKVINPEYLLKDR